MWTLPVMVWILWAWNLSRGNNFRQDNEEGTPRVLGAVSTVEDLLQLLYPQYALVQRCLRRQTPATAFRPRPDKVTWANHREAALHWDHGAIQVIMAEIERTACRPREVCLEVSREYPESTRHVYVPRCVSVHRCGGCCNHEALHCYNSSYRLVNKTLLELSPSKMDRSVIMVTFVNHTACECRPKRPLHSIIRREADAHRPVNSSSFSKTELDPLDAALLTLCGPNMVLDPEQCRCACRNGLTESSCGRGRRLDNVTCECVCKEQREHCPSGQTWDPERCTCACPPDCPPHGLPPQPAACVCQCRESPRTCLLQGKRFNPQSCSCYRLPCRTPYRKCPHGFYFSHYVCSCLPEHMRTEELS